MLGFLHCWRITVGTIVLFFFLVVVLVILNLFHVLGVLGRVLLDVFRQQLVGLGLQRLQLLDQVSKVARRSLFLVREDFALSFDVGLDFHGQVGDDKGGDHGILGMAGGEDKQVGRET